MIGTRNSSLLGKITVLFVICCCSLPAQAKYGGGTGEPNDPYLIYTAEQMNEIGLSGNSEDFDKCFKLMADIDLGVFTGTSFNIIGYYVNYNDNKPFTGVFDGNGHSISNFTYNSTGIGNIGLFGYVDGGVIKNLGLINAEIDAGTGRFVGSLVGRLRTGTITNCYVQGGSVSGDSLVGGLVGNNNGSITDCYARGHVSVRNDKAGGLVGRNSGRITNCYSTGTVSGDRYIGGLVGNSYQGTVTASFWDFQASSPSTSDGGVGLTTAEMQAASTFIAWGCQNVWTINEGVDYPRLVWENAPGEPITIPSYGGGSGEPNDPYLIYTAEQLNTIGLVPCHLDKHFLLCADIDLDTLPPPPPPTPHPPSFFKAGNPNPAHGAFLVTTTADLSWTPGLGATSHNVYFGTTSSPPFVCNQTSTTFDPGTMALGAKYYWHIDEVNDSVITAGEIWNFTTLPPPPPTPLSLMADVDLGQFDGKDGREKFNIIGYNRSSSDNKPFTGVFDGNGHTISNFSYTSTDKSYIGLFGNVRGGLIKNLGLIAPNVDAGSSVGSLVGYLEEDGTIANCYAQGGSVAGSSNVGGLVGINWGTITNSYSEVCVSGTREVGGLVGGNSDNGNITNSYATGFVSGYSGIGGLVGGNGGNNGTINNCYAAGSVSGNSDVGGLAGRNYSKMTNCFSTGTVTGTNNVGGLVGANSDWKNQGATIKNCYSTAFVTGNTTVGGLIGYNHEEAIITNCYSTGSVVGDDDVGGLIGWNEGGKITYCYWDIVTSEQDNSAGGTGKTTAEMQMASTFIGWTTCGNQGTWTLDEGNDYPHLWWEEKPGDPLPAYQLSDFTTGAGTQSHPYLIYTAEQLNMIGLFFCDWDKHFKLMADIDLSGFTGTSFNIIWDFTGVFDGNGKKIFNFTYTSNEKSDIGLFRIIDGENAVIKDLGLIDPNVDAGPGSYVGSLVGSNGGTIIRCYVEGGTVSGDRYIGGLVGYNEHSIVDCYTSGNVTGGNYSYCVGGLCGKSTGPDHGTGQSRIQNCFSKATVTGNTSIGGLIGHSGAIVTGCYSTGSVTGKGDYSWSIGGLIGRNGGNGSINNSYSTGSVVGDGASGLVGSSYGQVMDCFWDIETSGQTNTDHGTGLPTDQMQTMSTFTNAGWDFVGEAFNGIEDIWFIPEGDYPHLWWEGMQVPMKLTPRTLNCRSEGNWVKAHLTLSEGFTVEDVDSNRPAVLHSFGIESAPLYVFVNKNERVQIEAAFEREAVCSLAGDWPEALTVAGFLTDGNIFLGISTVRIIHPGMKVIEELAWYWLNEDCVQPDFCNEIDMNRDSFVNLLDYALLMNIEVEFVADE